MLTPATKRRRTIRLKKEAARAFYMPTAAAERRAVELAEALAVVGRAVYTLPIERFAEATTHLTALEAVLKG